MLVLLGAIVYTRRLDRAVNHALQFWIAVPETTAATLPATVSVIIPAYNEADNIRDCILAVFNSVDRTTEQLEVWVVDDQSSDDTLTIAQSLQQELSDRRLHVLAGSSRPAGETWMGKNWACVQAAEKARGEYLLFLDADLRLQPGAIAATLQTVQKAQIDLLTLLPTIVCGCLAEWLAQPLINELIAMGADFVEINDPNSATVFAVGPFMLFRRSAYEQLGGHRAVGHEVVEDVELARRIKQAGMALRCGVGHDVARLRMYPTAAALWEGWTKNWYLGSQRNLVATLYGAAIVLIVCTLPWLGLMGLLLKAAIVPLSFVDLVGMTAALMAILLQYSQRQILERLSAIPPRYWWLTGIGGGLMAAIALASIIKTETGWGWTWRGRSLKTSPSSGKAR
jgi:glycosyltransferase involved in cell wall biosynthesis